ncbi:MAG TPA: hypothetical protein VFO34_05810 [Candidatus Acidoferrales bacterium]|nr:hypothetical protein [Candidatus Acidoferrales bacterium]
MQQRFNQAVALLHSFAYRDAENRFQEIAAADPKCAMAHWGAAMAYYHQLWDPRFDSGEGGLGLREVGTAARIGAAPGREQGFVSALQVFYQDVAIISYGRAAQAYQKAMGTVAAQNPSDPESQIFYALALLSSAHSDDKTHANQKQAVEILRPLYAKYPNHPGLAHYLIHACDNPEMAQSALDAARAYSKIAPSAPHALHMPSHIFTQLGMWNDSIESNRAARISAREHGDIGEELHAMDYLVYAYLQSGRDDDAARVLQELRAMTHLNAGTFKIGYAATAMPARYAIERRDWRSAAEVLPLDESPAQARALAFWARAVGFARSGRADAANGEIAKLEAELAKLRAAHDSYWSAQAQIQFAEAKGWIAFAGGRNQEAKTFLSKAANEEDALEKRPVTPGPIVPAREQLGDLLLELKEPDAARTEFQTVLKIAPGRKGALDGAARAEKMLASQD